MTTVTLAATMCLLMLLPGPAAAQDTAPTRRNEPLVPSTVASIQRQDGLLDGAGRGAAVGALAALAMAGAQMESCNAGCDWNSTAAIALAWSIIGAGVGSTVGLAADFDARQAVSRPPLEIGVASTATTLRAHGLEGRGTAPSFALAVQLSPHFSVHAEYTAVGTRFGAAPGAVPDDVLRNVVETSNRIAGRRHGIESRRVTYVFSELIGFHPLPWGRVRLELLGGLGVQGEEERGYYDAYRKFPGGRDEPIPGKYQVLNFGSPEVGLVVGLDVDVALVRGLSVVPTFRYRAMGESASLTYGVGAQWRF